MSSEETAPAPPVTELSEKSKGKQAEQPQSGDMSMDEDESSGEESGPEEVRNGLLNPTKPSRFANISSRLQKVPLAAKKHTKNMAH